MHMLRSHVSAFRDAAVVRSRDPDVLAKADIVVDVGARYDVDTHRYDHHQRGFITTFSTEGKRSRTKLSSAGLVYKHFGKEVVMSVLQRAGLTLNDDEIERVYLKVYDTFMEAIDAIDNGISMFDSDSPPRYESSTDLSARVGRFNADWFERNADQDANFQKAMLTAGGELDACIERVAKGWLPARAIVAKALSERKKDHESGQIVVMREWAPWKDHLFEMEAELEKEKLCVLYVVYQDMTGSSWRVQCVPVSKGSFESRRPLPEMWRGLRDGELSKVCQVEDCVFVHASGFIGGNKRFEGAMEMAKKALEITEPSS